MTGCPGNVRDQHLQLFALKDRMFRETQPHPVIINVTVHRPDRALMFELIGHLHGSDITGMPDLISEFDPAHDPIVDRTVRITQ